MVAGVVVAIVATRGGGGGDNQAAPPTVVHSTASSGPRFPSTSPSPTLNTGGPSTPAVSWAHFGAFSRFVGSSDHAVANTFKRGSCTLNAAATQQKTIGIVDAVACTYPNSPVRVTIGRFDSADHVQSYVDGLLDSEGYQVAEWGEGSEPQGLAYLSQPTGTGISNITTSICGLPDYLVEVAAPNRQKVTVRQLYDDFWNAAIFPDVSRNCNTGLPRPRSGGDRAVGGCAAKNVINLSGASIRAILQRGNSSQQVVEK